MAQRIEVKNLSTLLSGRDLDAILGAVAAQANEDVAPIWNTAQVEIAAIEHSANWSEGAWQFIVADTPDQVANSAQGYLGDHDQSGGRPTGYALVAATRKAGLNPSVTIAHELLEMIGDPRLDKYCKWSGGSNPVYLSQELCDPVEDDTYGYSKNAVLVSDFVTPAYFIPGSAGPWDFCRKLIGPYTLGVNGYQQVWDPQHGTTNHTAADPAGRAATTFGTIYSRRMRRITKSEQRSKIARTSSAVLATPLQRTAARATRAFAFGRWSMLTLFFIILLIACAGWIATTGWGHASNHIRTQWLAVEATLICLCVVAGYAINRRPDGIFIDEENRISLGRVQWVAWFVVLLGGFFTESVWNVAIGWNPANGPFPAMQADLYALLGIVSGSAVVGGLITANKKNTDDPSKPNMPAQVGTPTQVGLIDANVSPQEASWEDLYLGEEVANRNVVDVSRLQKLVITVLLVLSYVQLLWTRLGSDLATGPNGHVPSLPHFSAMPQVSDSFLWLLGISHAAYLAYKAAPKTPGPQPSSRQATA